MFAALALELRLHCRNAIEHSIQPSGQIRQLPRALDARTMLLTPEFDAPHAVEKTLDRLNHRDSVTNKKNQKHQADHPAQQPPAARSNDLEALGDLTFLADHL